MALNLHWVFDDFHNGFCPSRVCLFLNECLKSFIKTLQPEVQAEQKRLSVWGGGGGGQTYTCIHEGAGNIDPQILIPMHTSLFLGKPIDVRYCFDCLPC